MNAGEDRGAYHLSWIDRSGNVLVFPAPIVASSDGDAVRQASDVAAGDHVELWKGLRFVARLDPEAPSRAHR